jgi:pimeloyl-ACP methyl ester carboxylesterase
MAQDTIAFLETVLGRPSGGFHRDGFVRAGDQFDVDAVVAALGSSYGEVFADKEPTLVMFGDDDLMTIEHVNTRYEGIPDSRIVPGASRFLLQEKPVPCNDILVQFLTEDRFPRSR